MIRILTEGKKKKITLSVLKRAILRAKWYAPRHPVIREEKIPSPHNLMSDPLIGQAVSRKVEFNRINLELLEER